MSHFPGLYATTFYPLGFYSQISNFTEQVPSCETYSCLASQEISCPLYNLKLRLGLIYSEQGTVSYSSEHGTNISVEKIGNCVEQLRNNQYSKNTAQCNEFIMSHSRLYSGGCTHEHRKYLVSLPFLNTEPQYLITDQDKTQFNTYLWELQNFLSILNKEIMRYLYQYHFSSLTDQQFTTKRAMLPTHSLQTNKRTQNNLREGIVYLCREETVLEQWELPTQ